MAIITYKTPYVVNGQPVVVSFGLKEGVACNMVFSYPFLSALKASVIFDNMTLMSGWLGEALSLEAMVPMQAAQAPSVPAGVPGAFQATQSPGVAHEMMRFSRKISSLVMDGAGSSNMARPSNESCADVVGQGASSNEVQVVHSTYHYAMAPNHE